MEYENINDLPEKDRNRYRIEIAEGVREEPQQPQPLTDLRRLRRFNLTLWQGAYLDQPHIAIQEMNAVIDAEIAFEDMQAFNRRLQKAVGSTGKPAPE